jgi:gamma-carbonic anhydrase
MIGKLLSHHRNKFWKAASEVVREVGLTLYVRGSFLSRDMAYLEPHPRHRVLNYFEGELPEPSAKANIMPTAALFGNVAVGKYTTIWYGAILRGEANIIRVG